VDKENSSMWTKTNTKGSGRMTRPTEEESIVIKTERLMTASGKMISKMEKELKGGLTVQFTKETTQKERSMAMGSTSGMMGQATRVCGKRTRSRGLASIHG